MFLRTQILLITILLLALGVIINMVRKRVLELKYVLAWMGCDISLIILICFPRLIDELAKVIGIHSPMNMIFFLGFVFSLVIIFSLTVALSHVTANVRRIAQMIALLPDDIKKEYFSGTEEKESDHSGSSYEK